MSLTQDNLEFPDFPYICRICLFKGDTKPFTEDLQELVISFARITVSKHHHINEIRLCVIVLD